MDEILSIVTPTFNRGDLLHRCYESLKKQTCPDFEWIIVDDGSTDNTQEVIRNFINDSPDLKIRSVIKENGGKHTALNASHEYISGKYVLILDSDDFLTEDAVQRVLEKWELYENNSKIGVLIFLRGKDKANPFAYGELEYRPGDLRKLKRVELLSSDCCEVIRSEIFKKYPFPVFLGERFLSEGVLWNRVAENYLVVYINEVVYIGEYLTGGLTDSGRAMRIRNPLGGMLNSNINMNRANSLKIRIKNGLLYDCYGYFAEKNVAQIIKAFSGNTAIKVCCMFPSYILYRIWKKKYEQ